MVADCCHPPLGCSLAVVGRCKVGCTKVLSLPTTRHRPTASAAAACPIRARAAELGPRTHAIHATNIPTMHKTVNIEATLRNAQR